MEPVRHEEPECEDFRDEEEVLRFERAMRVHRAHTEPFRVTPLDDRADGSYRVEGASGSSWIVDIVDLSGTHDACGCPDFLMNELGTCKHVEVVRRALAQDRARYRALAQVGACPSRPTLVVDGRGALGLRVVGPAARQQTARFAAQLGLDMDSAGRVVPSGPIDLSRVSSGRIVHAAPRAIELLCSRRAIAERRVDLLALHAERRLHLDVLREPLFPYQQSGVLHLAAGGRALLADDMGLGKTVQAIAACEVLRARGEARRILIVTPASLKDQWAKEIARYAGARAVVVSGAVDKRHAAVASDAAYTIINYELTWRDLSLLAGFSPDVLVLDEVQRAKNFRTKTAATLRALPSRFLFALTGTPIENRLDDLYSLLQLVDPVVLGPLWRFNLRFHEQNERGKVVGYKGLAELRTRIADVVLRRRKEEVLTQLPPLTEQTRHVPLSAAQVELEEHYRTEAAKLLATAERRALRPEEQQRLQAMLLKARQACDAAELCDRKLTDERSPKLDELEQIVADIVAQGGDKVLVFSEWTEMLRLAAERLDALGVGWEMLHGGVPTERRPALLDAFRADPDKRVLLSTDAGGVGLNLQVASYVVHLDLPWNPGRLDQRTARAHRLGQTRGVSVVYLCAERGIERGIEGTLAGKRALRGAALDPTSETDAMEAPSFSVFVRELRDVMVRTGAGEIVESVIETRETDAVAKPAIVEAEVLERYAAAPPEAAASDARALATTSALPMLPAAIQPLEASAPAPSSVAAGGAAPHQPLAPAAVADGARSTDSRSAVPTTAPESRLRLAAIVLEAGFPGDAVRAAYDGLAGAVRALLPSPAADGHASLVAAIYRDLVPSGRVPPALHGTLSQLNDLSQLETHGVPVDRAMAADAVAEAARWVSRLKPES